MPAKREPEEKRSVIELNLVAPNRFYLEKSTPSDEDFREGRAFIKPIVTTFIRTIDGREYRVRWRVAPNPAYGLPRAFTKKVESALIYLAYNQGRPVTNPIYCGSLNDLGHVIGLKPDGVGGRGFSGPTHERIKQALQVLAATPNHISVAALYEKRSRWINTEELMFMVVTRFYFKGERHPNGQVLDQVAVDLNPVIISNLNTSYVRPIDWTYYRRLTPVGSRFYEQLGPIVYAHLRKAGGGAAAPVEMRYSVLCEKLALSRQAYKSKAIEKCRAFSELVETGYFEAIEWRPVPGEPNDWNLVMRIGPRARDEYSRFGPQSARQLVLVGEEPAASKRVTQDEAGSPSVAEELVRSFYEVRYGSRPEAAILSKSDVQAVQGVLDKGLPAEFLGFLWKYASAQARKGRMEADRPGGAVKLYLTAARAVWGHSRSRAEAAAQEAALPVRDERAFEEKFRSEQAGGAFAEDTRKLLAALRARAPSLYTFTAQLAWSYVLAHEPGSVTLAVRDGGWQDFFTQDGPSRAVFAGAVAEAFGPGIEVQFAVPVLE